MQRFFVPPDALQAEPVRLGGDVAHQIARVLRLSPGSEIILLDNLGAAYLARLLTVTPREATAAIVDVVTPAPEWGVRLTLYQAVPRAKKIEWVLQKGTELGVNVFAPMISARCQGLSPDDFDAAKLTRWRRIVAEAAEQSERAQLPVVQPASAIRRGGASGRAGRSGGHRHLAPHGAAAARGVDARWQQTRRPASRS